MASPSRRQNSDVGRTEDRKSVLAKVPKHDRDGLTAPTPRAPSTAAEGSVGGLFAFGEFRTDFVDEILTLDHELGHWVALVG